MLIIEFLNNAQSNNPPIPSSYYSTGFGAYFFFSYFLASTFGASTLAAGWLAAGADEAAPPKLKKEVMSCPSTALAKSFGQ